MLQDKIFYAIHNENFNKHPTMVTNGMYFSHLEHSNCNHVIVPSMNVECNYEMPIEQSKYPPQTSMDYGYSSHCSSEEAQNGLYDNLENGKPPSIVDDDEVFHLELSNEKLKGTRSFELKHKLTEDKTVRLSYMNSE